MVPLRAAVEQLLSRHEETTRPENRMSLASGGVVDPVVRGLPRLLFCGVAAGPLAHGLLLPHEPLPSPLEVYAVCVVPTESLLAIETIDVNMKEWTLSQKQGAYSIRVDEIAKFCHLVLTANAFAVEVIYAERCCWQSDEWLDFKQRYRGRLITNNVITKLMGPAKDYLVKRQKHLKYQLKQQRRREEQKRKKKSAKGLKTKERSEERQKELALVEEKMLIKAEQRCKKTEERKQREQAKAASTTTDDHLPALVSVEDTYNRIRLLFQAKRILNGHDPVLSIEQDSERILLLDLRQKQLSEKEEERLLSSMLGEIEQVMKEKTSWKGAERPHNVHMTLLDSWIVELRRKDHYFWLTPIKKGNPLI